MDRTQEKKYQSDKDTPIEITDAQSDTEEEILVYAEFEDSVDIKHYRNIHILGINEKAPIIQLDDTFFTGTYEVPLGTYMFFEEDASPESQDPLFDKLPEKNLKYACKTRKLLKTEHAYVTSKENKEQSFKKEMQKTVIEIPNVKFRSVQEAIEQFKTIMIPNTNTLNEEPMDTKS